jgi:hypothetical protein
MVEEVEAATAQASGVFATQPLFESPPPQERSLEGFVPSPERSPERMRAHR